MKGGGDTGIFLKKRFKICKHPSWGLETSGDAEEQVSGRASPAGAVPGRGSPEAPRRDLCTRSCARARQSSLCRHELPAASVCRWRRGRRRWGPQRRARGRGPVLLQPAALESSRPQPSRQAGWRAGELGNRFSSTSPPLCHSLRGAERAREGRELRGGLGLASPSAAGARAL